MSKIRSYCWLCLISVAGLLATSLSSAAFAGESPPLAEVLRERDSDRLMEMTFLDGRIVQGYVVSVHGDSLQMRQDETLGPISLHALSEVTLVREWRSNTGTGIGIGAVSGGVIVGGFGLLVGAYVASINEPDSSDVPAYIVGTALGAMAGMVAGGTLGAGLGALSSSWHSLWPEGYSPPTPEIKQHSEATRVGLFAGAGTTLLDQYEVTRFVGRASVRKNVGEGLSMGPEISYHDFGGHTTFQSGSTEYTQSSSDILKFAFVANIRRQAAGLSPYATLGAGWFLSNDAYLGAHAGGGLRWQYSGGNDLELDLRYHFSFSDVDSDEVDRFWTMGLGMGFGL